jgi:hypothetical protein
VASETYQLVVRRGPRTGQTFPLSLETITIGRDPLTDIVIEDPEVSRLHARLTRSDRGYALQDMGSTNGTFVEGQRLGGEPLELEPGQVVILGSNITLAYEAASEAKASAEQVEPAELAMPEPEPADIDAQASSGDEQEEVAPDDVPAPVAAAAPALTMPLMDVTSEPEQDEPALFELPPDEEEPALFELEPDEAEEQEPLRVDLFADEPGEPTLIDAPPAVSPAQAVAAEAPTLYPSFSEPTTGSERGPMPPLEEPGRPPLYDSGAPSELLQAEGVEPRRPMAEVVDRPVVQRDNTTRNVVIAVAAVMFLCCCLALALLIAAFFPVVTEVSF